MAKQKRANCSKQNEKCRKEDSSIDRISMLPDELLVFILSLLTFKEAAATSILSRRWRYLWTFTPRLDFNGTKSLMKVKLAKGNSALLDEERLNYVKWVNHVIALRKDSTIEDFKVYFSLSQAYKGCIDEWLKYALARKVQTLELNLSNESCASRADEKLYSFPYRILDQEICFNYSEPFSIMQRNSIHFKQLKKISLTFVNVNGEALEFFLRNCPLLEHLSVSQSRELSTLRIAGSFPSLKHLEISLCYHLTLVEIRDVNLVHLKYDGNEVKFILHNVPMLVDIFVGSLYTPMEAVVRQFWSIVPQLERLNIQISQATYSCDMTGLEMSNLKQLVVIYLPGCVVSLLPLTNLLRAAPCLEIFVLKTQVLEVDFCCPWEKIESLYPHLKEIEFVGYWGGACELELVMHFLENPVVLEKIIIDTRKFYSSPSERMLCYDPDSVEEEINARARAKEQLADKVPRGISLEIL